MTRSPDSSNSRKNHEAAEEPPCKKQRQSKESGNGTDANAAEPSTTQPGVSKAAGSSKAPTSPLLGTAAAATGNEGSSGGSVSANRSSPGPSAASVGSRAIQRQQHQPGKATSAVEVAEMQAHELHTKLVEVKISLENGAPKGASAAYWQAQQQLVKLQEAMEEIKTQLMDHATS